MKLYQEEFLRKAKEYAISKGGECLATEYKTAKTKTTWDCKKGHTIFEADFQIVSRGSWCTLCSTEKRAKKATLSDGLKRANAHASKNEGWCLSTEYKNSNTKMRWKCKNKNHPEWEARFGHIISGSWCPQCAKESLIFSIQKRKKIFNGLEKAKKLAKANNGNCLSTEYISAHKKLLWKCSFDSHPKWESSYKSIFDGRWCPKCADHIYYKEDKVRNILNYLLDTKFIKSTPKWNINPKSKRLLELDGYSEKLKIAFEFQGAHHYQKSFNASDEVLEYIKYKDKIKKENCIKQKIKLLIIDDGKHCDNNKELLEYVLKILANENIIIDKKINYDELQEILNKMTDFQDEALQKARKYAESHKGRCLSTTYTNAKDKLEWKCEDDSHPSFFANLRVIYRNSWCKRCSTKKQWKNNPPNKKL